MFCEKCGRKTNPNSKFCEKCGHKIGTPEKRKNIYIALILSLILSGLGTVYAGNKKKGLIIIALRIISAVIGLYNQLFSIITFIVFIYAFYDAYREVQHANGVEKKYPVNYNKKSNKKKLIILIILFLVIITGISIVISLTSNSYHKSFTPTSTGNSGNSDYKGVDTSPSTIARKDPDWYYDHYEYEDNDKIDEYLESQGFD